MSIRAIARRVALGDSRYRARTERRRVDAPIVILAAAAGISAPGSPITRRPLHGKAWATRHLAPHLSGHAWMQAVPP